jgi:hypothetical protein
MRGARIAGIVLVAAVVGFLAARSLRDEPDAMPPEGDASASATAAPAAEAYAPPAAGEELRAEPGGTIAIDAASLEPGRPVVLHLAPGESPGMPDESSGVPGAAPRPARIVSADGTRSLEGAALYDPVRGEARFEVDPEFLEPGRYIVEMRVPSLMPLNLARYVVEVR